MKKELYTDYCVCFTFRDHQGLKVQFFDEIKNRPIMTIKVLNQEDADKLMDEYVAGAPEGIICQKV